MVGCEKTRVRKVVCKDCKANVQECSRSSVVQVGLRLDSVPSP